MVLILTAVVAATTAVAAAVGGTPLIGEAATLTVHIAAMAARREEIFGS